MSTSELLEAGGTTFLTGVKVLGTVTVAFFVLLASLLYFSFYVTTKLQTSDVAMVAQMTRIEGKLDNSISISTADRNLTAYLLRQICINGASTDLQKQSCNPPPSILQRQ